MSDHVESTAVEVGTDLVPAPPPSPTLFRTDDPVQVVERASVAASALNDVLRRQRLTKRISGREHVLVEGWTTLGSMLGVVPVCTWTRKLPNGWEARVEARTLDGRTVGAAEAQCTRDETTWADRDDYALRSMAQTRATSKALRGPLGFVVALAGFDTTPSEEMDPAAPASAPAEPLEASPQLQQLTRNVLAYLLAGDETAATSAYDAITKHFDGSLPAIAGQAIAFVGRHVKDHHHQGDQP